MTLDDVIALAVTLHDLYSDKFPGLTAAMADIWQEELVHLDEALVRAGLRRWVLFHTHKAPSLDELKEAVEIVRDAQKRLRPAAASASLARLAGHADVLAEAAQAQAANPGRTPDAASYGHLIATLGERHLGPWRDEHGRDHGKLTLAELAAQCRAWAVGVAARRPQLAQDLTAAAAQYDGMAAEAAVPF